ncbi:hypothetical protein A2U01_0070330, partial [Trifolium medium]|nr:hypothetical protein [Trifolium medium]
ICCAISTSLMYLSPATTRTHKQYEHSSVEPTAGEELTAVVDDDPTAAVEDLMHIFETI